MQRRSAMTIAVGNNLTLSISTTTVAESAAVLSLVANVTVADLTDYSGQATTVGILSGHEYNVSVRAHDLIGVGTDDSQWARPNWPAGGGPPITDAHTATVWQLVRVDTTPPQVNELALFRDVDGFVERLPVLTDARVIGQLRLAAAVLGLGYSFVDSEDLAEMRLLYGLYDAESGLRQLNFVLTETSLTDSSYNRTTCVGERGGGEWVGGSVGRWVGGCEKGTGSG